MSSESDIRATRRGRRCMKWRPRGSNDLLGFPIVESKWSSSRSCRLFATSVIVCGGRRAITTAAWKAVTAIKRPQKLWDLRQGWRDISPAMLPTRRDEYGRLCLPPVVHVECIYHLVRSRCIGDTLEWPFHGHWFLTLVNHSLKKILCEMPLVIFPANITVIFYGVPAIKDIIYAKDIFRISIVIISMKCWITWIVELDWNLDISEKIKP